MKIILNGACGHMGKVLIECAEKRGDKIAAAVDKYRTDEGLTALSQYEGEADVIIDFSHHAAAKELCAYALRQGLPLVIATTGQNDEELALIREAAQSVPVFCAHNMSLGIALLIDLAKKAAAVFPNADIEIVETHHRRKIDAPSGTANMIFRAIKEVLPEKKAQEGRSGFGARKQDEIGISSLRMGNIVGIHEVHFTTDNQSVVLRHEAYDRALFADGALSAADFLVGRKAGLYNMNDLIKK